MIIHQPPVTNLYDIKPATSNNYISKYSKELSQFYMILTQLPPIILYDIKKAIPHNYI